MPVIVAFRAGGTARGRRVDQEASEDLEVYDQRHPTQATYLGIHTFDDRLEDYSRQGVTDEIAANRGFRERVAAIDSRTLSASNQLDHEQLLRAIDSRLLTLEAVRPWAREPDSYSGGLTRTAYIMIKREFAPPEVRLRQLIAREKAMPAALAEARKNLENPPRISTEIAIEQMDGNRGFFETAVATAFPDVTDKALLAEFKHANDAVIAAMADYKTVAAGRPLEAIERRLCDRRGNVPRKLAADEMIDMPLDELLAIAERDLAGIRRRLPRGSPDRSETDGRSVSEAVESDHPPAEKLLSTTQAELDALGRFMTEKRIVTIPKAAPARVEETPPFLRATTTASIDIPGPFETVATEAYYNMTLPDPKPTAAEKSEFMTKWYYAAISNVSVHEVWPGHYLQFLYARNFPSDIRKVFGAATNSEGWAHYCEQMVIDEGFHADDPRYRLAQIQDALLRDARFIVGIRMHTQGMTIAEARRVVREGGLSAAARRRVGKQARHVGCDLRLLHDGKADDPEAARRL